MQPIRRILVPTDFSPASEAALERAIDLAKLSGAEITLQHVYLVPAYAFPDGVVVATPEIMTDLLSSIGRHLDETAARVAGAGVRVGQVVDEGSAASEIVRRAETGFDLIVMGTHGRQGLSHLLLGSVAERVVRRARCPVLTVHPPAVERSQPAP